MMILVRIVKVIDILCRISHYDKLKLKILHIYVILCAVYPALDASDDEDYIFKPKAKSQIDEAWNPKARVGPLLPKTNRPAREGVKKTSVEKGLEAAAAKRAKQSVN